MNAADATTTVLDLLAEIAPESDVNLVDHGADLRTEVDLDSMDFLNLVEGIAERTGVDIPEADYSRVRTLDGLIGYLTEHDGHLEQLG